MPLPATTFGRLLAWYKRSPIFSRTSTFTALLIKPSAVKLSLVCPTQRPLIDSGVKPNTCPSGTITSAGVTLANAGFSMATFTVTPPAGAGLDSCTRLLRLCSTFSVRSPVGSRSSAMASTRTVVWVP